MMKKANGGGEDGGGSNSRKMISELPEGLLQRVIYFLSQEEAVRTSILSKSWRYTWSTRSNIDFSETTFKGNKQEFLSAVDKTLQRYCDQGPPLEEFSLCISLVGGKNRRAHRESVSLLDKWIPIILTTMGVALKEFRLSIVTEKYSIRHPHPCLVYDLIGDLLVDNKKIQFERLQVLALQKVFIKQETIDKILSTCTLLTTMWFQDCRGFETIKLDKKLHKHLKHFTFIRFAFNHDRSAAIDKSTIEIGDVPTLETIESVGTRTRFRGGHKLNNLKSITLKLPCFLSEEISIDAPNLLYFEYWGRRIPSISYAPNCRRSSIALSFWGGYNVQSWFLKTSELLQSLSHSEISLDIFQSRLNILSSEHDTLVRDIINGAGIKPVVVEHLQLFIEHLHSFPSFLNVFFTICRPRNVVQNWGISLMDEKAKKEIKEYLLTLLATRQDLEDLSIQRLDRCGQWRPVQGMKLLECAQSQQLNIMLDRCGQWRTVQGMKLLEESQQLNINRIRFQMKWRILGN